MARRLFPENVVATVDDFRSSPWRAAIDAAKGDGYPAMWRSLSVAAQSAIDAERFPEAKILWLMADACSMALRPSSTNDPFQASSRFGDSRSAIPDDFDDDDIALLGQIAEETDDTLLRARLADLVWLRITPRSPRHALLAVDAYRTQSLDVHALLHGGREMWARAISLARSLKAGAEERLDEIELAILSAFEGAQAADKFLAIWLADLLYDADLAIDRRAKVAAHLNELAALFEMINDLHSARSYYDASAKWQRRSGDDASAAAALAQVAETWVKDGIARSSSDTPSNIAAAHFFEKAIQTYRSVPRSERAKHGVQERIAEVHKLLSVAGEKSLAEMSPIESPPIDIAPLVEIARGVVADKPIKEALAAFVSLYAGAKVPALRESAERTLSQSVLRHLFESSHMSGDGRVIAKTPGAAFQNAESEEHQAQVWSQMITAFSLECGLITHGSILPALEVLLQQHRWREGDFIEIARMAPIVPAGRELLVGKALFAGFDLEFDIALHLLTPQIENLVRRHIKSAGGKTANVDHTGIENENGLSALMDLPEAKRVFGENLAFEIKALFCDPLGPNLRNMVAHGLLEDPASRSVPCIYAWWFMLKLVYTSFWNAHQPVDPRSKNESSA